MSYRVTVMPQAASDFEGCFGYIFNRSHQGAIALRKAFGTAVKSLEENALAHGFAPESGDHPVEIRQILFRTPHGRNYRAIYHSEPGRPCPACPRTRPGFSFTR